MICITIDCEEWNSAAIRGIEHPDNNKTEFSRLGNEKLFNLFDKYGVLATFFVTGFFARKEKKQVREIIKRGHEVACHGDIHFYRGNKKLNIENDVKNAKNTIEGITKKKLLGFRAPQGIFSKKLMKVLEKNKFVYDSSMHPAHIPMWYNHRNYPLYIHKPFKNIKVTEIPIAAFPGTRWPMVWLAMRTLGPWWTIWGSRMLLWKDISPNIYFHSWEFTNMQKTQEWNYLNMRTGKPFLKDLEKYIKHFKKREFVRLKDLL